MDLIKMIEELNEAVDQTLSIDCYGRWCVSSYREGSLFSGGNIIWGETFEEAVIKAYKTIMERVK